MFFLFSVDTEIVGEYLGTTFYSTMLLFVLSLLVY